MVCLIQVHTIHHIGYTEMNNTTEIMQSHTDADDDSGFVLAYLDEVAGHWETISRNLHVKVSKIEELTTSCQTASVCLGQAITDWLKLNYNHQRFGKPTWKKVAEMVVKLNNGLFLRIAAEHTAPGETTVNVDEKMSALAVTKAHGTSKASEFFDVLFVEL